MDNEHPHRPLDPDAGVGALARRPLARPVRVPAGYPDGHRDTDRGDDHRPYGLAIKAQLEACYDESVNHGRLYPNLDTLVERGLVAKSEYDDRTNRYELTELGVAALEAGREAIASALDALGAADIETEEGST